MVKGEAAHEGGRTPVDRSHERGYTREVALASLQGTCPPSQGQPRAERVRLKVSAASVASTYQLECQPLDFVSTGLTGVSCPPPPPCPPTPPLFAPPQKFNAVLVELPGAPPLSPEEKKAIFWDVVGTVVISAAVSAGGAFM